MLRRILLHAAALIWLAPAISAQYSGAQTPASRAQLRGRVVDSIAGTPIDGATVELEAGVYQQVVDTTGRFAFRGLVSRRYQIRIHRLGYQERSETLFVAPGDTVERTFSLRQIAAMLGEMRIGERLVKVPFRFQDAYKRAASGRGAFFVREDIDQLNPPDFHSLLNRVAGVSANDRGITFQRCQGGLELARQSGRQRVQVWIDGYRVSGRAGSENLNDLLRLVRPSAVQIMEVYTSASLIPAQFLDDACAVIVIWTKSY